MKTLRYCLMTAGVRCNENRHAQIVINELGIKYEHCVPQSISDSWEFWGCTEVPKDLPEYIKVVDWDPIKRIGRGLSPDKASELSELYMNHREA